MGCILGRFENIISTEPKILCKKDIYIYSEFYIDYYLATRFNLWD